MEAGSGGWYDGRSELAAVSGAVSYTSGFSRLANLFDSRSRACPSVRLSVPMVAAVSAYFRGGLKCRRALGRPKRHEDMREPMERG
jgi:hypothetical protein